MATIDQLTTALINADKAGDVDAARQLAAELTRMRGQTEPEKPQFAGGMAGAAALGAADTASFGFGDELGAGLGATSEYLASFLTGDKPRSYDELLGKIRDQDERAQATNPGSYLTGQVAGGVGQGLGLARGGLSLAANAAGRGASFARVAGASAVDGGGLGFVQGFGSGEGLDGRLTNAGTGMGIGMGLGGAAPYAVAGASKLLKGAVAPFAAPFMPETYARDAIGQAVRRSGKTPDQIAEIMQFAADEGQPMYNVADAMGHTGERMMSTVARNPSDMRQTVVEALRRRQTGQGERLSQFVAEGFDATDTAAQRQAALTAARGAEANALYGDARRQAGAVNVTPIIDAIDETLSPGVNSIMSPRDRIANDSIEGALSRVRSMITDGKSNVTDFNTLFRTKLDLDDMIQRAEGQGAGNRAHYLSGVQRRIDNALADASLPYAQARDAFATGSRRIEAIDAGKTAFRQSQRADDTIDAFSRMTPDEQAAFRSGYADPAMARVEGMATSPTTNKARVFQTPKYEEEFQTFAAPGEADRLGRRIGREQRMFDTASAALGGSKTADNLADAADMQKFDPGVMSALLRRDYIGAVTTALTKSLNAAQGMPPGVIDRVAKSIVETNPTAARNMLARGSAKLAKGEELRRRIAAALVSSGAAGAGRLSSP